MQSNARYEIRNPFAALHVKMAGHIVEFNKRLITDY
jgi:hypothetical protein